MPLSQAMLHSRRELNRTVLMRYVARLEQQGITPEQLADDDIKLLRHKNLKVRETARKRVQSILGMFELSRALDAGDGGEGSIPPAVPANITQVNILNLPPEKRKEIESEQKRIVAEYEDQFAKLHEQTYSESDD